MSQGSSQRRCRAAAVTSWIGASVVCVIGLVITRPPYVADSGFTLLLGRNAEYLPFLPLLLLGVLAGWSQRRLAPLRDLAERTKARLQELKWVDAAIVAVCGVVAFAASSRLAAQFEVTLPAYHDEFSYLFQAQTFLRGGVTVPGFPDDPALFDQMHVLSGERMASRYFPGTGIWMAPFVAMERPWLGHRIAHGVTAALIAACGLTLGGRGVAIVSGLVFGLSPGLVLFSNLLLAHHPTLVGLLVFLLGYLRWQRSNRTTWLLLSGIGLSYAMLCRPMTAAGFALPFGVHLMWAQFSVKPAEAAKTVAAMGAPLVVGFALLLAFNRAVTGSVWETPYQRYTDVHTPRHVYGFANAERGEKAVADRTFDSRRRMTPYDLWATNLTTTAAAANVGKRIESSLRLTLGIVPLVVVAVFILITWRSRSPSERLIACSIATLHAAHVPYWFSGIMHWHYVLESAISWALLTGVVTRDLVTFAVADVRDRIALIWPGTLLVAVCLNTFNVVPWFVSETLSGAAEVDFARTKYARFFAAIDEYSADQNLLVLVRPNESEPQIDYVVNEPGLTAAALYVRVRPGESARRIASRFPERIPILFDAAKERFERVR